MSAVTMPLRRKFALAAASLAAVAPVLSSCGFDYATDRPNVIANGGYAIHGNVKVLAARIVATAPGAGGFVATISNRPQASSAVSLTALSAPGVSFGGFSPIAVKPGLAVNLADAQAIGASGTFKAGDALPVTLTFSNGSSVTVDTVVVTACHEYASATPSAVAGKGGAGAQAPTATASPYSCDYPSLPAFPASE